jgi:hypothetical protein
MLFQRGLTLSINALAICGVENLLDIGPDHDDRHARQDTLLDAFGTASGAFATTEMLGLMLALRNRK